MTEKSNSRKWDMVAVIISIISLIASIVFSSYSFVLANQANSLTAKSLELQNMLSNFNSTIGPADWNLEPVVTLEESGWSAFPNGTVEGTAFGYLNFSLKILTPHYAQLTFRVENLSNIAQDMLNTEMTNQTEISLASFWHYEPPYIIGSGLTQLNVSLPLTATIYPNSSILPEGKGNWIQFPLGTLWLEAELYDLQAQTTYITEIPALIFIEITVN
jgi:hypothetical protein